MNTDMWHCSLCGKWFPVPSMTKAHERREHAGEEAA